MPILTSSDHVMPKSTLRHRPIAPNSRREEPPRVLRASRTQTQKPVASTVASIDVPLWTTATTSSRSRWWQRVPMIGIGVGMVLAVTVVLLSQLLIGWMGNVWNDVHYGSPRTYQTDAFVGHETGKTPSHFIALNLNGQIEVIEVPGGDASHAKIYLGPHLYGADASLVPVTLQFVDNRHDRQPDMLVLFQGSQMVFHNAQGTFHAPPTTGS